MNEKTVHIIGGGITGCSLAYFLKNKFNVKLYEKNSSLGGLCRTHSNLEGIPYQLGSHILHTSDSWILKLFEENGLSLDEVKYEVAIDPLFDFRYYNYPFDYKTIYTMPWHWQENILLELENISGGSAPNLKELIINFYGETAFSVFYENMIKKWFNRSADKISIVDWYRYWLRPADKVKSYFKEQTYFPKNKGYNSFFNSLTSGVEIIYDNILYYDLPESDIKILTGRPDIFFGSDKVVPYINVSFDIDTAPHDSGKPDMMIYPNHTSFLFMSQFGKFFYKNGEGQLYNKNAIVKVFTNEGEEEAYPVPTKKSYKIYENIVKDKQNMFYAGVQGSYKFLDMADCIKQASEIASEIIHKES